MTGITCVSRPSRAQRPGSSARFPRLRPRRQARPAAVSSVAFASCQTAIPGATSHQYTPVDADGGGRLAVAVAVSFRSALGRGPLASYTLGPVQASFQCPRPGLSGRAEVWRGPVAMGEDNPKPRLPNRPHSLYRGYVNDGYFLQSLG